MNLKMHDLDSDCRYDACLSQTIKYHPPPPFHPHRPLHLAAALCKYQEIIDLLLDDGAEVDPKNNSLSTPLSTACQANNLYAASRLIAKGTVVSVQTVLLSHKYCTTHRSSSCL